MTAKPPKLDERTASDVVAQLVKLLADYTTAEEYPFSPWGEYDPATKKPTGASAALIGVFARFSELAIDRLNQVPDKNFRAFLDLLGAARLPPTPMRVPLTFSLAAGRTEDAIVPAGTKVAAQPAPGDTGPIVFEVEQPLVVTSVQLGSLVTFDPEQDLYADRSGRAPATSSPFLVFQGDHASPHVLYLGDDRLLGFPKITALRIDVTLQSNLVSADAREIAWERWDGAAATWVPFDFDPAADETASMTSSGKLHLGPVAPIGECAVDARTSRWIRSRLLTPITPSAEPSAGMVRAAELPEITDIQVAVDVERSTDEGLVPDAGFTNGAPLDLTKEFFPFGEKPKRYDSFFLASREGFSIDPTIGLAGKVEVSLDVQIANAHDENPPAPNSVQPSSDLKLVWECSIGGAWEKLGESVPPPTLGTTEPAPAPDANGFADGTFGFCQNGVVTLLLPEAVAEAVVNGQSNTWLRVRIVAGNYGNEASYVLKDPPDEGYKLIPANFRPPVISKIAIGYQFTAQRRPDACLTYNDLGFSAVPVSASAITAFAPFHAGAEQERPGLCMGLTLPAQRPAFPNTTISLYASLSAPRYGKRQVPVAPEVSTSAGVPGSEVLHTFVLTNTEAESRLFHISALGHRWLNSITIEVSGVPAQEVEVDGGGTKEVVVKVQIPDNAASSDSDRGFLQLRAASDPDVVFSASFTTTAGILPSPSAPRLLWQYWNGSSWAKLAVRDDSAGFTRTGLAAFLAPRDFTPRTLFGRERYWVRALWDQGEYSTWPRLHDLRLNTTTALQSSTIVNEVLGSSNGGKGQTFSSSRFPVLDGPRLEVREAEMPRAEELALLRKEEGDDPVHVIPGAAGRRPQIWVRWHEVPDFYGSGPHDRHYVIDHLTGAIRFGDGLSGRIPPIGPSNLRLARYQTSSGGTGNRRAGTVTELKTTVPYVDKVTNLEDAAGGADAEPLEALYDRVPRALRHRNRAVSLEDYQDLAALASPDVARSHCVPLRDLAADPLGATPCYGMVSVVIVPRDAVAKPQPALELLDRTRQYLSERTPAGASLAVVGPLYIRVDVRAEIAVGSIDDAGAVEHAVRERLAEFLHPLTGGLDQRGWDFGRKPHRSDVLALLEAVPGVDHVRYLQIDETEDLPGIQWTGRFLVYSGQHQIDLVFEET